LNAETLRLEYKRLTGREHPPSCEEAQPGSPCRCRCKGLLHGIAWRATYEAKVNLVRWFGDVSTSRETTE
jgi:hypothetical protein